MSSNFRKLKCTVVILAKQHQESNAKLEVQLKSNCKLTSGATFHCKMNLSEPLQNNIKMDEIAQRVST